MLAFKWTRQGLGDHSDCWHPSKIIGTGFGAGIVTLSTLVAAESLYIVIKIAVSPKLWILQELSKLIK